MEEIHFCHRILSLLPFALVAISRDKQVLFANPGFHCLFNDFGVEVTGRDIATFLSDPTLQQHLEAVIREGGSRNMEIVLRETPHVVKAMIMGMEGAENPAALLILEDISEKIKLEEELVEFEKLSGMEYLAASIAHELGNPLTIMESTFRDIKKQLSDNALIKKDIQIIEESINRMDDALRALAEFQTIGFVPFEFGDINEAIAQILTLMEVEKKKSDIQIKTSFDDTLPRCWANFRQLKQVFLNLIKNAIEALMHGGKLVIATRFIPEKDTIAIDISDTGMGMLESELSMIFKPFYSSKKHGRGLGLPFCRRIITEHGGGITVKSVRGKGSTFTITLPVGR